jgi:hypothetical protein
MACEWYLIVGLAKTGTTAVAMTLLNTLKGFEFLVEPRELTTIEQASAGERRVIKIIFDHWQARVDSLKSFVRNSYGGHALTTIAIVRDPRDEAVSRLHYAAFDYFSTRSTTEGERAAWIEIFRRKEEAPDGIALIEMQDQLMSRFGCGFLSAKDLYETYRTFIDDIMEIGAPAVHLLRYEDFVSNTFANEALQAILSGSRDVDPKFRRVYRSGSSGAWQHFLTDSDIEVINETCKQFLRQFNYPFDRTRTPEKLCRATGSDYVAKLIDEARSRFRETEHLKSLPP